MLKMMTLMNSNLFIDALPTCIILPPASKTNNFTTNNAPIGKIIAFLLIYCEL